MPTVEETKRKEDALLAQRAAKAADPDFLTGTGNTVARSALGLGGAAATVAAFAFPPFAAVAAICGAAVALLSLAKAQKLKEAEKKLEVLDAKKEAKAKASPTAEKSGPQPSQQTQYQQIQQNVQERSSGVQPPTFGNLRPGAARAPAPGLVTGQTPNPRPR